MFVRQVTGPLAPLQAFGLLAFALAVLSIGNMYLPRPYDGVVLEADVPGQLIVRKVVPGSGADRAGIEAGDQIIGIARNALRSTAHAATLLNQRRIGETVPYLIRNRAGLQEAQVQLGRRRIACLGSASFSSVCSFCCANRVTARGAFFSSFAACFCCFWSAACDRLRTPGLTRSS
jgi:hypothetical protein